MTGMDGEGGEAFVDMGHIVEGVEGVEVWFREVERS
jgi:hypothetical protein